MGAGGNQPAERGGRNGRDVPHNIEFALLPDLSWEPGQRGESLQKVADYVAGEAETAIRWYLHKKAAKSRGAQWLRVAAISAVALAGLIPILAQMFTTDQGQPAIAPAWASVALLVAAACIGLDRFFGFSSGWMRFLTTEMEIRHVLHDFLLDWEMRRAAWEDGQPDATETEAALKRCKDFLAKVNEILRAEMDTWVREFSAALADIEQAAKAQAEVMRTGSVNVTVTNGEQSEDAWRLSLDGGAEETCRGRSAALHNVVRGAHKVTVKGRIDGKDVQAEKAFVVAPGQVGAVELTLA